MTILGAAMLVLDVAMFEQWVHQLSTKFIIDDSVSSNRGFGSSKDGFEYYSDG